MELNTKENRTKRQEYDTLCGTLWTEMQTFIPVWRDLAEFVKPRRRGRAPR